MSRSGPKPLPLQLGLASLAAAGLAGGTQFTPATLQDYFRGIQKYQQHDYKRTIKPLPIVWQKGEARLFYAGQKTGGKPILLIPSMINRSDILDLIEGQSLTRWLAGQGFEVYLLDWGTSTKDPEQANFDLVLSHIVLPAIQALNRKVSLIGYCMGGLIAAATAALYPDHVKSLTMLASPWNFHDEQQRLKHRLTLARPVLEPYLRQQTRLPESFLHAIFASLDPENAIRKFANFATMADNDPRASSFVAVEDWLNEGVDLPSAIARTCLEEWYEQNLPHLGTWHVCGQNIRADEIRAPTLVIAGSDDQIVPLDSALAFDAQRSKGERIVCKTGHIGLIVGRKAIKEVWQPLADWHAVQQ